ncbi:MAG TPA: protein kinase [Polyangiaceae bacterium]|nr:protein kinase [Polyangiaceae bacterium]
MGSAVGQVPTNEAGAKAFVGKTIAGRYHIDALVDEGGAAVVYEARHETLGKRVALKLLPAGPDKTKAMAEQFLARAKLAASLTGPYVNRISDFGQSAEGSYVVMDWLEGEPLAVWVARTESLVLDEVLPMVRQVAQALAAAHARGVVHGDLEMRRLLRVRQGDEDRIKVLGFGERADAQGDRARADIRALGEVLLELASRARFDGVTTFAVRRQREAELDADVGQRVQKLPAALQAIVVKALALETAKAYGRVEDLSDDLERFRTGEIPDALLEMIASGSWALIPQKTGALEAVERAVAARRVPVKVVAAPAPVRPARRIAPLVRHRQTALVGALVAGGLLAGWFVSGLFAPSEDTAIVGGTARVAPTDSRSFGPDE